MSLKNNLILSLSIIVLLGGFFLLDNRQVSQAQNEFGSNLQFCQVPIQPVSLVNPTTITDCSQAGFQTALEQGGHINFNCGGATTIPITLTLLNHQQ